MVETGSGGTTRRYTYLSILSGLGWGLLVAWLASGGFHGAVLGGVIASPVIGWLVGRLTRGWSRLSMLLRIGTVVVALYLAAALFGLFVGIFDVLASEVPNRIPSAVVFQTVLGFLWGLTFTGYLLLLGPLAYANLWLLARIATERP